MKFRWWRRLLAWLWLASVLLQAATFRFIGEDWPLAAVSLYVPAGVWLVPGTLLALVALISLDWRMLGILCLTFLSAGMLLFGWRWQLLSPSPVTPGELKLTILTHNTGQRGKTSLQPFKNRMQPDFLVLQDARARARRYLADPGYEEFPHAEDISEFTLVSRYPIVAKEIIPRPYSLVPNLKYYPLAARFEVAIGDRRIAIYNVHAFSPRDYLGAKGAIRTAFYSFAAWPGTRWAAGHREIDAFWNAQLDGARALAERFAKDPLPIIVAGDFNAPPQGAIYRIVTASLLDSHERAGHGCGYTFPGATRNPLAAYQPWLRLDYVLASKHWRFLSSVVEPDNPSQHRALAATMVLHSHH